MTWEHPGVAWFALGAAPLLGLFFYWSWRTRQRLITRFVQSRLLPQLTSGVSETGQKVRLLLLLAGVFSVLLALARPQWGFHWEEARQRGLDVIVAIDTSRSMLAEDLSPSRLARAKLAALDLKRLARSDRVGLVAFAGSAFLQCPLSFDDEAFRQSVNALDVSIIPQGGTALAEAIETARAAFKEKNENHKVLVIFSDGEDHDGRAVDTARAAAKEGMRIFTVGVGTPNGELLRISDGKGRTDYIRDDQGNVVKSRLNERLLQDIAETANGFSRLLSGAQTMDVLYERGLAPLPKSELSARRVKRHHERYQWPLALAFLLLAVELLVPEYRKVPRLDGANSRGENVLKYAGLLVGLLLVPLTASSASARRAEQQFRNSKFKNSLNEYEELLGKKPNDPRLHYNASAAAYRAENYERALKHLNSALLTEDLALQQKAYYNRGNTQYRLGEQSTDPKEKMAEWEEALSSYNSALKLDPNDADAKHNLELVKEKLDALKKEQQQQQQQDGEDKKEDQDKKQGQDSKDQKQDQQQQQQDQSGSKEKQDQQQANQQKQGSEDQQKQEQQQSKSQEQKDQQAGASEPKDGKSGNEQKPGEKADSSQPNAQTLRAMAMTPQQAQQLLDAQRGEEKAMIFIPQIRTNRNPNRVFKDW